MQGREHRHRPAGGLTPVFLLREVTPQRPSASSPGQILGSLKPDVSATSPCAPPTPPPLPLGSAMLRGNIHMSLSETVAAVADMQTQIFPGATKHSRFLPAAPADALRAPRVAALLDQSPRPQLLSPQFSLQTGRGFRTENRHKRHPSPCHPLT